MTHLVNKRHAFLFEMMVNHIIMGRIMKALKIAQYLRSELNLFRFDLTLDTITGFHNYKPND